MSREGPFPGMDPWLEKHWGDIHQRIITYASDALNGQLPDPLAARVEERVFDESPMAEARQFIPDVRVVEYPTQRGGAATAVAEPELDDAADAYLIGLAPAEVTESYIEIRDFSSGGLLVTLIEVVSRSNKISGEGRKEYLKKQKEALDAKVNVVEIDLLRGGRGVTLAAKHQGPERVPCPYHASIFRQTRTERIEFFPIQLSSRLPKLRIPLRKSDKDVVLDLQKLLSQAYVAAKYAMTIDYSRPPVPPLSVENAAWAEAQVGQWRQQTDARE